MLRKILVPLDGSELAERALPVALQIAEQDGGSLILMRAPLLEVPVAPLVGYYDAYGYVETAEAQKQAADKAYAYLQDIQRQYMMHTVQFQSVVLEGDAATNIVEAATQYGVQLIVMSTHGYSGFKRWMLGSVTERVLSGAPCPVLVVRDNHPLKNVLITLDGSPLSEHALTPGLELASALNGNVTLLRVMQDVPAAEIMRLNEREKGLGQRLQQEIQAEAELYLDALAKGQERRHVPVQTVARAGLPPETILDYAQQTGMDVLVMATHGRTGLQRWVYGSVTQKVLLQTDRAMLIVRPKEEDLLVPVEMVSHDKAEKPREIKNITAKNL